MKGFALSLGVREAGFRSPGLATDTEKEVGMAKKTSQTNKPVEAPRAPEAIKLETVGEKTILVLPFSDHLRRVAKEKIPGLEFDPQMKAWQVPSAAVAMATSSLDAIRAEHQRMEGDRSKVIEQAQSAVEHAVVKNAFKGQEARTSGKILAVGEFYVAQSNGKNFVAIHELGILRQAVSGDTPEQTRWDRYVPAVGEQKSIVYKRGVGVVQDRVPEKARTTERVAQPEARR